jgi:hypothetical protein
VVEPATERAPAVPLSDLEMPPAAVERDLEVGVVGTDHPDHDCGRGIEPARVDFEMLREIGFRPRQDDRGALAYRLGRPQPANRRERRRPFRRRAHRGP